MRLPKKCRKLFKEILEINKNAIMLDKKDKECSTTKDVPNGCEHTKIFVINKDNQRGITYVQYKI